MVLIGRKHIFEQMNWIAKTLTIVGVSLVTAGNLSAVIPDKYQTILDRNAFGLLPPPPPPAETNTVAPPANLKLTGFATIGGERRVFFTIPPKDAKEVQQYINLSEGEREGTLEIVSIAESDGEVRIRNAGIDTVLSLDKDGFKPAKLAPGMMPAPMPMAQPGGQVSPVYNPGTGSSAVMPQLPAPPQFQPPPSPPGLPGLPGAQPGQPGQPNMQQPNVQQTGQPNGTDTGERTIPTRTMRTLRVPPVQQGQPGGELQAPMPQ